MAHTHDSIDWTERLTALRRADEIGASVNRQVAERLIDLVSTGSTPPVVVDVGSGAGGMSAAFAAALTARGGGRVVLADAVDELLHAASEHVREVAADGPVRVDAVRVDAADDALPDLLPTADLVWASRVVHHLPDQQQALNRLAAVVAPGGWLALGEGGLATRCLPWDIGIGEPGLGDRLAAAQHAWFARMRAEMPGSVRLPIGWTSALSAAGLTDTHSFSYLIDLPAPAAESVRLSVVDWLRLVSGSGADDLGEADREVLRRLVDPADEVYVGARDDVFVLAASTVHLGRRSG